MNSRSFDNMKIKNECDICATEYLALIDIEWKYELNNFVYRSLKNTQVYLYFGFLDIYRIM